MCFVSVSWVSLQSECAVAETGKLPELELELELETRTSIFRSSTLLSKDSLGEPFDT